MLFPSLVLAFSLLLSLTAAQPLPRDTVIHEYPTILRERVAARQFSARAPSRKRDTSSPQPSPQYCPDPVNYEIVGTRCLLKCKNGFSRDSHNDCTKCQGDYEVTVVRQGTTIQPMCVLKCASDEERVNGVCLKKCTTAFSRDSNNLCTVCSAPNTITEHGCIKLD